jgi:hypothetical protein
MHHRVRKTVLGLLWARDWLFRYPRCRHTSHRAHLFCWRASIWDSYCVKHNNTCYESCS